MSENGAKVATRPSVTEDMNDLFVAGVNSSPFEGMIHRPLEPVEAPSLFFFFEHDSIRDISVVAKLNGPTEVSNMVQIVKEAFHCICIYNLNLFKTDDQVFNLLCLQKRFLASEGALEKQPSSGSASFELEGVYEQLDSSQGVSCHYESL